MYDFYGGYGGMYGGVGSMLVQTYPGGPLVAAVPVPVPMQPVDWYRAPSGEVQYYYAMGYSSPPADGNSGSNGSNEQSSRRNSVESFQSNQVRKFVPVAGRGRGRCLLVNTTRLLCYRPAADRR